MSKEIKNMEDYEFLDMVKEEIERRILEHDTFCISSDDLACQDYETRAIINIISIHKILLEN